MDNINIQTIEGFTVQLVSENVWAIDEFGVALMYLVIGQKKALLIDTGMGLSNVKKVVETLTKVPYDVVNTHGHFDHMGGNGQFEAAYMHPKTQELRNALHEKSYIEKFAAKVFKDSYFTGQAYATAYAYRDDFVALPVEQGFVFDLGGRTLEVIETPGHTRGCISLLDSKNKLLFDGDVLVSTPTLIFDWYSPEIEVYRETLEKLWELRTSYDLIFPGHFIKPIGQIYLRDMRICIDNLLRHEAQGVPVDLSHIAQEKALAYQYGKARVYYSLKKL